MTLPPPVAIGAPAHFSDWRDVPCRPYPLKSRTAGGYGLIRDPKTKKGILAHRQAWIDTYGAIPKGMCVCHRCDNPECIEIRHLFLGTSADNNRDRHSKGRSRGGSLSGEHNPAAKLTADQVRQIRALDCIRRKDWQALEAQYGIGIRHLYAIRAGEDRLWSTAP